jgi:hypothetical protein
MDIPLFNSHYKVLFGINGFTNFAGAISLKSNSFTGIRSDPMLVPGIFGSIYSNSVITRMANQSLDRLAEASIRTQCAEIKRLLPVIDSGWIQKKYFVSGESKELFLYVKWGQAGP